MVQWVEEAVINAPADTVFSLITDFSGYHNWNPWVVSASGGCVEGNDKVVVTADVGGRLGQYRHKILTVQRPSVFVWCDLGWFTVLAYGERRRELAEANGQTHYRVSLTVTGSFAWLVKALLGASLAKGLKAETQALKRAAEKQQKRG